MSVLIAPHHVDLKPWIDIRNTSRQTWASRTNNNSEVIWVRGRDQLKIIPKLDFILINQLRRKYVGYIAKPFMDFCGYLTPKNIPKFRFDNTQNELRVKTLSTYLLSGRRNLATMQYFLDFTDYDFLFSTSSSSYINIANLEVVLANFNANEVFAAGVMVRDPILGNPPIISGAGRLLSRASVAIILENHRTLTHNSVEDVCMGRLINKLQMKILPLQRVDIESESEALNLDSKIIESNFHFRCKAFDSDGKRIDSKIMIALESRLS